jgi:hypothetical protein
MGPLKISVPSVAILNSQTLSVKSIIQTISIAFTNMTVSIWNEAFYYHKSSLTE